MPSRTTTLLASAALAVGLSIVATAAPALAAETARGAAHAPAARAASAVSYTMQSIVKTAHVVNYANELARCVAGSPGITCTISRSVAATNTYGVAFGLTSAYVGAQLNISSSSTTTVGISCTSPALAAGRHFVAFPVGTQWGYRILKRAQTTNTTTNTLSGPLTAYRADNAFLCTVG